MIVVLLLYQVSYQKQIQGISNASSWKKLEHVRVCRKYFLLIDFGVHKSTLFDVLTKCLHILYVKPLDKVFIIPCQCYFIFKHFGFQFLKYILSKDSIDQMWPMKCFWWLPKKFHALFLLSNSSLKMGKKQSWDHTVHHFVPLFFCS